MLCTKKIAMEVVGVINDILTFKQIKTVFKTQDKVIVIIRNVKTGEEFQCSSSVNKEFISIELGTIKKYFTDYEGAIFLSSCNNSNIVLYSPILINPNILNNTIKNNYNWYLRVVENGELRLSTVCKK